MKPRTSHFYRDRAKVVRCLKTCETAEQFEVAKNYAAAFFCKHYTGDCVDIFRSLLHDAGNPSFPEPVGVE